MAPRSEEEEGERLKPHPESKFPQTTPPHWVAKNKSNDNFLSMKPPLKHYKSNKNSISFSQLFYLFHFPKGSPCYEDVFSPSAAAFSPLLKLTPASLCQEGRLISERQRNAVADVGFTAAALARWGN